VYVKTGGAIKKLADLKDCKFAISRWGSGSELMTFLLAEREQWKWNAGREDATRFVVAGTFEKMIDAVVRGDASAFIWNYSMTQPMCDGGSIVNCGEIYTPWPCFVTAVRDDVWARDRARVTAILSTVAISAMLFENNAFATDLVAHRFGMRKETAAIWFASVKWAVAERPAEAVIDAVVKHMHRLNRLSKAKSARKLLVAPPVTLDAFVASRIAHRRIVVGGLECFCFEPTAPSPLLPLFGTRACCCCCCCCCCCY
jgi:sulfonate transport system substrate-binding protein